jgi:NAD(P)-dependent dehydrogenase (short-subunit alcohol dehydrogenase family)/pimeloyl-ACP methyl ester carboxylesterase
MTMETESTTITDGGELAAQSPIRPVERHVASPAGATLAVWESGELAGPTVVLVHGYPDTHGCWDELAHGLAGRFHVVTYDVRGIGASTAPERDDAYSLEQLTIDLQAVLDAVSPDAPVHLVGHDWGAIQGWDAVTDARLRDRIASFTAIAGPRVDAGRDWALRRLRPSPAALAQLAGQARRSWYIAAFQLPLLPERVLTPALARSMPAAMARLEGIEPRPGHPAATLARDARAGIALYRTNLGRLGRRAPRGPAEVPVQLIVPTRDHYITTPVYDDAAAWARDIWRRDIRAGHWAQRSHPAAIARHISELIDHVDGVPESGSLRRARARVRAGERGAGLMQGKLAVVTGAGSGIGRATTLALAEAGAEVVAADVDYVSAAETVKLAGTDGRVHAAQVDVADADAMERFATSVDAQHGVPEIVVNNAGIGVGGPFLDTTLADWERIIAVNLWGVIHGARLFGMMMVKAGVEGQIVNLASAAAYTPSRALPAYSTTKAAVLMLSECLRAELAEFGIGVSAICPGVIDTNITRTTHMVGVDAEEERRLQERAAELYHRRGYGPEGVASAIVRAVLRDRPVVPVTPEAHVTRTLSLLAPGLVRRLARVNVRSLSSR